jgi:hypothetical protein
MSVKKSRCWRAGKGVGRWAEPRTVSAQVKVRISFFLVLFKFKFILNCKHKLIFTNQNNIM